RGDGDALGLVEAGAELVDVVAAEVEFLDAVVQGVGDVHVGRRDRNRLRVVELAVARAQAAEDGEGLGGRVVALDTVVVRICRVHDPGRCDSDALDVVPLTDSTPQRGPADDRGLPGETGRVLLQSVVAGVRHPHRVVDGIDCRVFRPRVAARRGAALTRVRDVGAAGVEFLDSLVEAVDAVDGAVRGHRDAVCLFEARGRGRVAVNLYAGRAGRGELVDAAPPEARSPDVARGINRHPTELLELKWRSHPRVRARAGEGAARPEGCERHRRRLADVPTRDALVAGVGHVDGLAIRP